MQSCIHNNTPRFIEFDWKCKKIKSGELLNTRSWSLHRKINPVVSVWVIPEMIPELSGQSISFNQNPTIAAPSGAHVSGRVIQASDRVPRSTHWLCVRSVCAALCTWNARYPIGKETYTRTKCLNQISIIGKWRCRKENALSPLKLWCVILWGSFYVVIQIDAGIVIACKLVFIKFSSSFGNSTETIILFGNIFTITRIKNETTFPATNWAPFINWMLHWSSKFL